MAFNPSLGYQLLNRREARHDGAMLREGAPAEGERARAHDLIGNRHDGHEQHHRLGDEHLGPVAAHAEHEANGGDARHADGADGAENVQQHLE